MRQTGDVMKIEEDQAFYLTISQNIIDKNIKDHECKRYPTSDYKNYEECDIKFMRCSLIIFWFVANDSFRDYLDKAGYPHLTPIWATNEPEKVTWKTEITKKELNILKV